MYFPLRGFLRVTEWTRGPDRVKNSQLKQIAGTSWVGSGSPIIDVLQLQSGPNGELWVTTHYREEAIDTVAYLAGITANTPVGSHWMFVVDAPSNLELITVGTSGVYGITKTQEVWHYNGKQSLSNMYNYVNCARHGSIPFSSSATFVGTRFLFIAVS